MTHVFGWGPGPPQPNPPLTEDVVPHEHLYICNNCDVTGKGSEPFNCWLCGEPCSSTVAVCETCNQHRAAEKTQGGL